MDNELKELLRSVIREEVVPLGERLHRMETNQREMRQDLQSVKQEQQSTRQDLQSVKQEQQSMRQDMQTMMQDQVLIKRAVLETNDRLKNVESILENQHRIIELLSARSIEQEAQLKRIN